MDIHNSFSIYYRYTRPKKLKINPHLNARPQGLSRGRALPNSNYFYTAGLASNMLPKAIGALKMAALANDKVSNKPNRHQENPKKIQNS